MRSSATYTSGVVNARPAETYLQPFTVQTSNSVSRAVCEMRVKGILKGQNFLKTYQKKSVKSSKNLLSGILIQKPVLWNFHFFQKNVKVLAGKIGPAQQSQAGPKFFSALKIF